MVVDTTGEYVGDPRESARFKEIMDPEFKDYSEKATIVKEKRRLSDFSGYFWFWIYLSIIAILVTISYLDQYGVGIMTAVGALMFTGYSIMFFLIWQGTKLGYKKSLGLKERDLTAKDYTYLRKTILATFGIGVLLMALLGLSKCDCKK